MFGMRSDMNGKAELRSSPALARYMRAHNYLAVQLSLIGRIGPLQSRIVIGADQQRHRQGRYVLVRCCVVTQYDRMTGSY